MTKLFLSIGLILFGLGIGKLIQLGYRSQVIDFPIPLHELRLWLQKIALLFLNPITVIGAIWIIRFDHSRIILLPLLGLFAVVTGGFCALALSRLLRHDDSRRGSTFVCGAITNVGAIGGLTCYLFLGEGGYALTPFYTLLVPLAQYCVGFSVAKFYSPMFPSTDPLARLKKIVADPFILVSMASTLAGCLANVSGFQRPAFYKGLNQVAIPLSTSLLLVSAGLTMRVSSVGTYRLECAAMAGIKFLLLPGMVTLFGFLLGFREIMDGVPLKILLILSAMPVGFLALVPPVLYHLDADLANSCWLFTTGLLIIVLPGLYFLMKVI
jgi:hypothetical protein